MAIDRSLICLQPVDLSELSPPLIRQVLSVDPAQTGFKFIGIGDVFPTRLDNGGVLIINLQGALMKFTS